MITDEQLAQLKALAEAATPGPWEDDAEEGGIVWGPPGSGESLYGALRRGKHREDKGSYGPIAVTNDDEYVHSNRWKEDSAFIAAARNLVPALISEIERLRAAQP